MTAHRYLDVLNDVAEARAKAQSAKSANSEGQFSQISQNSRAQPLASVLADLASRCPEHVPAERWQQAIAYGLRFLAKWATRARAIGWTAKDLFGLLPVPIYAKPSFNRLARYDETGLIWLLAGREVVALTEATAAIKSLLGPITIYRRHNKPALGPPGDSLDDLA